MHHTNRNFRFIILFVGLAGCCIQPPQTMVTTGVTQTYLVAKPSDLRLSIFGVNAGPKDFPYVLLMLKNISSQDVVVAYSERAVLVHCGIYSQPGPAETVGLRRQILEPGGFVLLDPPGDGWTGVTPDGQPELMIPVTLPPGSYPVWATLKLSGPIPGMIESDKRDYEAKD